MLRSDKSHDSENSGGDELPVVSGNQFPVCITSHIHKEQENVEFFRVSARSSQSKCWSGGPWSSGRELEMCSLNSSGSRRTGTRGTALVRLDTSKKKKFLGAKPGGYETPSKQETGLPTHGATRISPPAAY